MLAAREAAERFLLNLLRAGAVPVTTVETRARAVGISLSTLERAKRQLGVRSTRVGGLGTDGRWEWTLPPADTAEPLDGLVTVPLG